MEYKTEGFGDVRNGKLDLNGYEIKWITSSRDTRFADISWQGLDCIIEAAKVATVEELQEHKTKAKYVIMTGTPKPSEDTNIKHRMQEVPVFSYTEGFKERFHRSQDIICLGEDRTQITVPLLRILNEDYGCRRAFISSVRPYYRLRDDQIIDSVGRIDSLGDSKRFISGIEIYEALHFEQNRELCRMILIGDIPGNEEKERAVIEEMKKRFPIIDAEITPARKKHTDRMGFSIEYDPIKSYTEILYDLVMRLKGYV